MDTRLILSNIGCIDTINDELRESVDVIINSGKIVEINPHKIIDNKNSSHIDCSGKYAVPGLFENHAHLTVLTNQNEEVKREILNECGVRETEGDLEKLVLQEFVCRGITQVRDVGGPIDTMKNLTDNVNQNIYIGPDIFYSGPMLQKNAPKDQGSNVKYPGFNVRVDSKKDVKNLIRQIADNGAALVKTFRDLNPDILEYLLKEAAKYNLPVTYDPGPTFFQSVTIDKAIEMGVKCIEHGKSPWQAVLDDELNSELEKLKDADQKEKSAFTDKLLLIGVESISRPKLDHLIEKMQSNDVYFCPTLHVFKDYIERPEVYRESKDEQEKIKSTFKILYEMSRFFTSEFIKGGIKILVGQDGWNPVFTFNEMKLLKKSGLSSIDIIKGATIYPAEWLRISDEYGSIEPNKKANILIMNENSLDDIDNIENVYGVIKDGETHFST